MVYCGVISTIFDISDKDKVKIISSKLQVSVFVIKFINKNVIYFIYKYYYLPYGTFMEKGVVTQYLTKIDKRMDSIPSKTLLILLNIWSIYI